MLVRYKFHLSLDLKYSFLTLTSAERNKRREEPFTPILCTPKFLGGLSCYSRNRLYRFLFAVKIHLRIGPSVAIYYTVNI